MTNRLAHHYIRQLHVNGVKLADILFSLPCVCEHSVQSSAVMVVGRRLLSVCPKCIRLAREKLIIYLESTCMFHWLSDDIVRFKIKVGF